MKTNVLKKLVAKFKDLLLFAEDNSVPFVASIKGEYGKYYVGLKLLEREAKNLEFEKSHTLCKRKKVDISFSKDSFLRTVEVKTFNEEWSPSFTKTQLELMDYFVILISPKGNPNFKHEYVLTKSDMKEILERGAVGAYRGSKQYLLYLYDSLSEYEDNVEIKERTKIERRIIENSEDFEHRWDRII
jgi:hypothetical protein